MSCLKFLENDVRCCSICHLLFSEHYPLYYMDLGPPVPFFILAVHQI